MPRQDKYNAWINQINGTENGFDSFSKGYEAFGFIVKPNNDILYREWAPGVHHAALIGDFSRSPHSTSLRFMLIEDVMIVDNWNRESHLMKKNDFGVFEITLENIDGQTAIPHDSKVKISMIIPSTGERIERIPTWIKSVPSLRIVSRPNRSWCRATDESRRILLFRPFTMQSFGIRPRNISSRINDQSSRKRSKSTKLTVRPSLRSSLYYTHALLQSVSLRLNNESGRTRSLLEIYCQEFKSWATTLFSSCQFSCSLDMLRLM